VGKLLLRTSRRSEWLVAMIRIPLVAGITFHFICTNGTETEHERMRILVEGPLLVLMSGCALAMAWRVRRRGVSQRLLDLSVVLDASIANCTLLAGVLFPWQRYHGLLSLPDVAIVPVLSLAAGLRLSLRSAVLGAAYNTLFFGSLLVVDLHRNAALVTYTVQDFFLYGMFFVAACGLAVGLAHRARTLAVTAAHEAERAARAQSGLTTLLQDQHDLGSLLSSALINADMLLRSQRDEAALREGAAGALLGDLSELSRMVAGSREAAYVELTSSDQSEAVPLVPALELTLALVLRRTPELVVDVATDKEQPVVLVAGGARGLERMLLNLFLNAAEGDSRGRATRLSIAVEGGDKRVRLRIQDDGPGFPAHVLETSLERVSGKEQGTGLGLMLVRRLVQASGGSIRFTNEPIGGAVQLELARSSA
jgi:signal transduction histidine kinase